MLFAKPDDPRSTPGTPMVGGGACRHADPFNRQIHVILLKRKRSTKDPREWGRERLNLHVSVYIFRQRNAGRKTRNLAVYEDGGQAEGRARCIDF